MRALLTPLIPAQKVLEGKLAFLTRLALLDEGRVRGTHQESGCRLPKTEVRIS